jgi:CBS domain-containing protein
MGPDTRNHLILSNTHMKQEKYLQKNNPAVSLSTNFCKLPVNRLAMNTVGQILAHKDFPAVTLPAGSTVLDTLQLMADKNIGSVVITDAAGQYKGIVTERDYSRKVLLKGKTSPATAVEEIMSTDLPAVTPRDTVEHCMQLMTDKNIRYLPVFSGSELKGIISMSDVVKATISSQQQTIDHLQQYISL